MAVSASSLESVETSPKSQAPTMEPVVELTVIDDNQPKTAN